MKKQLQIAVIIVLISIIGINKKVSGQANTTLSNLAATTAVNSNLLPQTNNTKNIGSTANSWMNMYIDGILYIDDARFLSNTGVGNSLIGYNAGFSITTGTYNTFTGENSGRSTTTGYSNSFYGHNAGYTNTTGLLNTFVGKSAGYLNNASYNTGVGASALLNNTSGHDNSAFGFNSLASNTVGNYNTAIGTNALYSNTTGEDNTAIGNDALKDNVSGERNTAIGLASLTSNNVGDDNVALGFSALLLLESGSYNVGIGNFTLRNGLDIYSNTAVGDAALSLLMSGYSNTAIGRWALEGTFSSSECTAVGATSLQYTSGDSHTAIGFGALNFPYEDGFANTAIGHSADVTATNLSNATALGYNAQVDASNKVRIGNSSVTSNGGQVNWTAYSDGRIKSSIQENVPGLQFINTLRPVTYHFDLQKQNDLLGLKDTVEWEGKHDIEKIQWTGFIAQEVEEAAKSVQYDFSGVDKSGDIMGLRYAEFVVPLVKAVQELSEQNTELQSANASLETRIAKLEALLLSTNPSSITNANMQSVSVMKEGASLGQNMPNPFTGKTSINYCVPESAIQAKLVFSNQNGVEVYSTNIQAGTGTIELDATQLTPGNYVYSLVVDGVLMASKQMILVK